MTDTIVLALSKGRLVDETVLKALQSPDVTKVILLSDGSTASYEKMRSLRGDRLFTHPRAVGVNKVPLYEARALGKNAERSKPNALYSDDDLKAWVARYGHAPYVSLKLATLPRPGDSKPGTMLDIAPSGVPDACRLCVNIWTMLSTIADQLAFPAAALEALTRWTYYLTPETMDIEVLRSVSRLHGLEYNAATKVLTLSLASDVFVVDLNHLNYVFGKMILPVLRSVKYRDYGFEVSFLDQDDQYKTPTMMTYGKFGCYLSQLTTTYRVSTIDDTTPIAETDLLSYGQVMVAGHHDTVVWTSSYTEYATLLGEYRSLFVRSADLVRAA